MAIPATLFTSTYQLYKSYTHDVLQWLFIASSFNLKSSATAPTNAPANQPLPQGAGRLKGKARKLAKESQKDPSASGQSKAGTEVVQTPVAVDQLVEMAQSVADNPAKMGCIPKPVIAKLEKTIYLRREYLSLYAIRSSGQNAQLDQSVQRENSQHAYFVQILERVLRILQPRSQKKVVEMQSDINSVTDGPSHTVFSTNDFYLLEVEEVDDDWKDDQIPVGITAHLKPKQPSAAPSKAVQQEAVLKEGEQSIEVLFAIYCLFTDTRRLRDLVRDHWKQYKDRKISLETVTVMSNMAIAATRKAEQDFLEAFKSHFPEPPDYDELSALLYHRTASLRGLDPEARQRPSDPYNYEMTDIGDLLMLSTGETLRYAVDYVTKGNINAQAQTHYYRGLDRSQLTARDIDEQEDRLLLVMIIEFVSNRSEFLTMQDELTLGMHRLCSPKTEPLSLWLVAANKMFVEIHHVMGDEVERAFEELQGAAKFADSSITRFLDSRVNKSPYRLWPESNNQELRQLQTVMIREHILGARFNKPPLPPILSNYPHDVFKGTEFRFHKQNPLLSGTQKVFLQLQMQRIGVGVGRAWGSLQFTAHAYNAFRQLGGLDLQWPELEWLIKFYTPEKMFAGHTPSSLDQCYKSYMLQYGVAPSQFACDAGRYKKDTKAGKAMKGNRDWTFPSRTIEIFRNWAMSPARHSTADGAEWAVRAMAQVLMPEANSRIKSRQQDVGPVAQILRVKELFDVEVPCLQFDFLSLHFHCMDFWHEIRIALHSYFVLRKGSDYLIGEENVAQLIGYILEIPVNDRIIAEKSARRIVQEPDYPIVEGTRVMKRFLLKLLNKSSDEGCGSLSNAIVV